MIRVSGRPLLIAAVALACAGQARAQQIKFEARYATTVARIPVGNDSASAEFSDKDYTIAMIGRASGLMRVLASGEGTLNTVGIFRNDRPTPTRYISSTTAEDDKLDVTMTFENGNVKELIASEPPPAPDRVPLTDAHRQNVTDPLTALFIHEPGTVESLSESICQRTLPIFDGRRRYDIKLTFKRMERVKADTGYAGPAAVCAAELKPIAGHRPSSALVKFLTEGREIEMTFAPVVGTRLLAPFRVAVFHVLGNLVVQASRFEVAVLPARDLAGTTGQAK
jgi:hypothetical protein